MVHRDTVFVMNRDETWLSVGFTISYVSGTVGCSLNYEANFGSKCQGWQANVDLHHTTNTCSHHGFCFVVNPINNLVQKIVDRTPPPNIESTYPAYTMAESIRKLWEVKYYEDQLALERVDNVLECEPCDHQEFLGRFINAGDNFSRFLEPAELAFLERLGLDRNTPDAYKFRRRPRPAFIHEDVIVQEYKGKQFKWRILHGRCPIIGIGGTKQSGHVNQHWPLVCHHIGYGDGEPWSLVTMCNLNINVGLEYLEGDPKA